MTPPLPAHPPAHYRSDENGGGEEDPAEEVSTKDVAGPQLTKEAIKEAMKGNKRVDEITPNIVLNQTILDHYHNVRWLIRIRDPN